RAAQDREVAGVVRLRDLRAPAEEKLRDPLGLRVRPGGVGHEPAIGRELQLAVAVPERPDGVIAGGAGHCAEEENESRETKDARRETNAIKHVSFLSVSPTLNPQRSTLNFPLTKLFHHLRERLASRTDPVEGKRGE